MSSSIRRINLRPRQKTANSTAPTPHPPRPASRHRNSLEADRRPCRQVPRLQPSINFGRGQLAHVALVTGDVEHHQQPRPQLSLGRLQDQLGIVQRNWNRVTLRLLEGQVGEVPREFDQPLRRERDCSGVARRPQRALRAARRRGRLGSAFRPRLLLLATFKKVLTGGRLPIPEIVLEVFRPDQFQWIADLRPSVTRSAQILSGKSHVGITRRPWWQCSRMHSSLESFPIL